MNNTTPLPLISAMRRSARRKKRTYKSSRLNFLIPHHPAYGFVKVLFVRLDQSSFLFRAHAGKSVIGRIAEHDQYLLVALNEFGRVALLLEVAA